MQEATSQFSSGPGTFEFGRWRFSADTGDLTDGEACVRLEPQVGKLLAYFLGNQHQVISRDELIASVWANRTVSDDAINRCVSILRQTLSPDDKSAYIETVVRKGYLAHFPPAAADNPAGARPASRQGFLRLAALACAVVLLLLAGAYYVAGNGQIEPARRTAGPPMVAVLPFTPARPGGDSEFSAAGIHDDLLTQLAQLQSLRVISATSMKEYRGVERNVRDIGSELGADVVLEGSVQTADGRIRINAQLIDARTDEHLWAESYDRQLSTANIFDIQAGIARAIALELGATLTAQDDSQLALIPTDNMAAYRAYHRALQLRDTPGSGISSPDYLAALEEAVALDPSFSRAWAELVSTLAFLNFSGARPEMTLRAEQALQRLQAVAPGSADHLIGQAAYVYYALKDYDKAHEIISRALVMNPSDVNAVELKSWIERRQGDFDAYLESKYEARRLDPRNPALTDLVLRVLLLTHHYDAAKAELENVPFNSFITGSTRHLVLFRDNRDFDSLQAATAELCQFYEVEDCGWEAHVANRDYRSALDSLDAPDEPGRTLALSQSEGRRIMTYWLMTRDGLQTPEFDPWFDSLEKRSTDSIDLKNARAYLALAMLAGIRGKNDESETLVRRWNLQEPVDWAERSNSIHEACRVLGMIGAADAAVQCIRTGLDEASRVAPFFEPYLPFYDPIREEAAFVGLLAEIDPVAQVIE
ncbi:MAG: winged helix-turn-helix domain-containing protein [Halieaceae bacterium]|nr:winged helix-turn-helix domain-containing protein [Halieaceae bacterium]